MPLFQKPYRSDVTAFLDDLKRKDPLLAARQREGRSLLWDRAQDAEAEASYRQARVAQQPYVYQAKPKGR